VALSPKNKEHTRWVFAGPVRHPGFYQVKLEDRLSDLYKIEVIQDEPPHIVIRTPKSYTVIDFGESQKVPLVVRLQDDYGIADATIVATIASGSGEEPAAMRAGLIERGVPADAIYRDPAGYRTWDSVLRARDVYGQKRLVVVSQRFHLDRALFLARREGIEAWGLEARDVDTPYSVFTELRRYPSALRAFYDVWTGAKAREVGKKIAIGVDPPS